MSVFMRGTTLKGLLKRSVAVSVSFFAIVVFSTSACENDVLDPDCTQDSPDITLNPDCPYANGRGPQVKEAACPPVTGEATGSADWVDVFSLMVAPDRGNCSSAACHGEEKSAALQIFLPGTDQEKFYETLINTKGTVGRPYVNQENPAESWIYCNMRGDPGGGFPMPKPSGLPNLDDAETVRNWLLAGAPGP